MSTSTTIVSSAAQREQLDALLAEYEESLPLDLRHAAVPEIDGNSNVAILAPASGTANACVFVTTFDDESAVIQRLYVRPAARGQGLARALMQRAADHARAHGFRRLVLDTDKEQLQPAYRLYCTLGFSICEPYAPVPYENPTYMELSLEVSS